MKYSLFSSPKRLVLQFALLLWCTACAGSTKSQTTPVVDGASVAANQGYHSSAVDRSGEDGGSGDIDGDGTIDREDPCPNEPGTARGCPGAEPMAPDPAAPPLDTGRDGSAVDAVDAVDSDSDGIKDNADPCPTVRGFNGGCPSALRGNSCDAIAANMMPANRPDSNSSTVLARAELVKAVASVCESDRWSEGFRTTLTKSFVSGMYTVEGTDQDKRSVTAFMPRWMALLDKFASAVAQTPN